MSFWHMPRNSEMKQPSKSNQRNPSPGAGMEYCPYFTPSEVETLALRTSSKSATQEEKGRQQACGFIEAVGAKLGFPRKTIATAQNLYHRFHLHLHRADFSYHDVTLAALYVSTKMHDTLKKPREILMAAYAVRSPDLAAKSKVAGELDVDPNKVEHDRQRLLAVERLMLEVVCFNFTSRMPFPYVIKFGRALKASKVLTKLAWRLTIDSHRTLVNLEFPPHVTALACLYLAALLSSFEQPPLQEGPGFQTSHQIAATLGEEGEWERRFHTSVQDLEEIIHPIIDLLIQAAQNPLSSTSPSTPASPHPSRISQPPSQTTQPPPAPYKADQLTRLKIALREREHPPRRREGYALDISMSMSFGKNEGTTRYQFLPSILTDPQSQSSRPPPSFEEQRYGWPGSRPW